MKTSRYSTAGGGMLPRMSESLSLSRSCCHSVSPRPPLPFSLPPRQLLPSSPPLEAQLTSVATERCASRRAWFYARFDIHAAEYPAFVYLSDTHFFFKIPIHLKKFFYIIVILKKKYSQDKVFQYICENWPLAIDILPSERSPEGRICFSTTQISLILKAASENR